MTKTTMPDSSWEKVNRPVRIRMQGGVGAGGESLRLTDLCVILIFNLETHIVVNFCFICRIK
ncbi:MAG: hypothetical protein KAU17_09760 [Spirochaetales bacterium]|nr:hypothetical protein [Spirochaetales bacterium]